MNIASKIVVLTTAFFLSACASIVSNSSYPVSINTSPEGAKFSITNKAGIKLQTGRTPALMNLKSKSGFFGGETYTVKIEKEGFEPKTFLVDSKLDGWYFGNILFGGLIGMLFIDPATGAMWKLPEHNLVSLDAVIASTNETPSLSVVSIDQLSDEEKAKLVKIQ